MVITSRATSSPTNLQAKQHVYELPQHTRNFLVRPNTQEVILREVASLVGGIERLFPLELDGPSPRARDVARRAKPDTAPRRRDAPR